jgi:hypothetical protein
MSGVVSALALGAVALTNFDLPGLIPIPLIAGLVLYLGLQFHHRRPAATVYAARVA